jgi:uncharacterized protein YjiS (DUF1127 family)
MKHAIFPVPAYVRFLQPFPFAARIAVTWWRARSAAWRQMRRDAADRRELLALDDLTLRDMGFHRSEIDSWIACGDVDRRPRGR